MISIATVMEKVSDMAGKVVSKGRTAGEIIKVKAEINTCENVIKRSYSAIGRKYYEMNGETGAAADFDKQMRDIKNAEKAIKELSEKLEDLKNNK